MDDSIVPHKSSCLSSVELESYPNLWPPWAKSRFDTNVTQHTSPSRELFRAPRVRELLKLQKVKKPCAGLG